jgi:Flp pilus assembly pilin Flp
MKDLILNLHSAAKSLLERTNGQGITEYAMAIGLIAFGCVAGEAAIATSVNRIFVALATTIVNGVAQ